MMHEFEQIRGQLSGGEVDARNGQKGGAKRTP